MTETTDRYFVATVKFHGDQLKCTAKVRATAKGVVEADTKVRELISKQHPGYTITSVVLEERKTPFKRKRK